MMIRGTCIETEGTDVLVKARQYFLFPNGPTYFYVSNFPREGAHKGCFKSSLFLINSKEQWPPEPPVKHIELDKEKVYKALLVWRKEGYKGTELREYYVKPGETHGYLYKDSDFQKLKGCFPLHWFDRFEEVSVIETVEGDTESTKSVPEIEISEPNIQSYEQLQLFDF
jgi:hypothetical protein